MRQIIITHPVFDNGKPIQCVYMIRFQSGHYYIGATTDLEKRITNHLYNIKKGKIEGISLPFLKRDDLIIRFKVLKIVKCYDSLDKHESFYLKKFNTGVMINGNRYSSNIGIKRNLQKLTSIKQSSKK